MTPLTWRARSPYFSDSSLIRTWQETYRVSATNPNRLMLFRENIAVYCENHMKHTTTLCGKNAEF
jgi:hypothetical protein